MESIEPCKRCGEQPVIESGTRGGFLEYEIRHRCADGVVDYKAESFSMRALVEAWNRQQAESGL